MIQVLFDEKGSGKTKRIISMANEAIQTAKGSMVFVDDDNSYMFDLKHTIRFIDASEYDIDGPKMFYGFLCGVSAQDFDLEYLFIDGFLKIVHHPIETLEGLFAQLEKFASRADIKLVISISGDPAGAPDFIKPYLV